MDEREFTRRTLLQGSAALTALLALGFPLEALAARTAAGEAVIPWLDQPAPVPEPAREVVGQQLVWEELGTRITPNVKFFTVAHFGMQIIREHGWRLDITGLVDRPRSFTLGQVRALPRREITFTLECSGNHGLPFLTGAIGNATWAGTPLAPLLREAGPLPRGTEIVFWGADAGAGKVGDQDVTEQFARSMSLDDALNPDILLCYEMNGDPLHPAHGYPVRLLAPGWYGIANVKWLRRIEVLDTPYEGRFMARDYVTQRTVEHDGKTTTQFTSVGRALLKSAPARVVRADNGYRIEGVAWGAPIGRVEARVDGGPWQQAAFVDEGNPSGYEWRRWTLPLGPWATGEHTVSSRAFDTSGRVQPDMGDPLIANKLTFWESNGQITRRVRIA